MKKIAIIIFLAAAAAVWLAASTYKAAIDPKAESEQKAVEAAKDAANLTDISRVDTYYGTKTYYVIMGSNRKKEKQIVWVPEKKGKIIIKKQKAGITESEARKITMEEKNPRRILASTPGIEGGVPIWEIKYVDQDNRYCFYYLYYKNGKLKRSIAIPQ